MNRRNILAAAFEELQTAADIVDAQADAESAEHDAIEGDADQIAEAEAIGESVDKIVGRMEGRDEIPQEELASIEIAVEHFRSRLGYGKQVMPALESFQSAPKASKDLMVANLKEMRQRLDANIAVAQEGLGARIINAFQRAFTSTTEIGKKTVFLGRKIEEQGTNNKAFPDAAWARIFAVTGKSQVNGHDVLALVNKYHQEHRAKLLPLMHRATAILNDVELSMSKSLFVAKDEEITKIEQLARDAAVLAQHVQESHQNALDRKASMDVAELDIPTAVALAKAVTALATDPSNEHASDSFWRAYQHYSDAYFNASQVRLRGTFAADLRASEKVWSSGLDACLDSFIQYTHSEFQVLYGAYKYLKASAA